jgi:hypothetical protein
MPTLFPTLLETVLQNYAIHAGTSITFAAGNTVHGGDVAAGGYVTGTYTHTEGEFTSIVDLSELAADMTDSWETAMVPQDNANEILTTEIGGSTFTPGTWHATNITAAAGATITLDGQGNPNSVFRFQTDTNMDVSAGVTINLINGAKAENIRWTIGSALTVAAGTVWEGSVLAGSDVTFAADTSIGGSVLALNAITFAANIGIRGSVMALDAITFAANNHVHGSVITLTSITFAAGDSVTVLNENSPSLSPTVES